MFEHFTFGVPARPEDSSQYQDVSPCDTSFTPSRSPSPPSSSGNKSAAPSALTDLLSKLEEQSLQHGNDDLPQSFPCSLPSPPADEHLAYPEIDETLRFQLSNKSTPSTPTTSSRPTTPRPTSSHQCRRLQRQMNTQLLCTNSQIQSIGALVDEMVSTGDQCNVYQPPLSPALPPVSNSIPQNGNSESQLEESNAEDVDEGFFEADVGDEVQIEVDNLLWSLRRANGPSGVLKYTSTQRMTRGPGDVLAKPRIRKRISRRKEAH